MAKNDLFRIALFGGYHKGDVQEYVKALESELEAMKTLRQKDEGQDSGSEALRTELEAKTEELHRTEEALGAVQGELKESRQELEKLRSELQEGEAAAAREKPESPEEGSDKGPEKDAFDHEVISEILQDARKNAELIVEDAKKERQEMLDAASEEIKQMKADMAERIDRELEDKGIQLMAAKHKIGQYMKEVKAAQEGLYNLYSRMNFLVENMPMRLDRYWDGENYRNLEDQLRKKSERETCPEEADGAKNQ